MMATLLAQAGEVTEAATRLERMGIAYIAIIVTLQLLYTGALAARISRVERKTEHLPDPMEKRA